MNAKLHKWHKTALAAAAATFLSLAASPVLALSLGSITVQSALGEPLRAEIDIPDINAEEAASLKASIATPDAFKAAGLEYNPAMSNLQVSLQRRSNGRAFIRLSSDKPINEPFVDMILEASWATGRIVRDYTMLFDPPSLRAPAAAAATAPQVSSQTAPSGAAASVAGPSGSNAGRPAPAAARPAAPAAVAAPMSPTKPKVADASGQQVTVKLGDTASKIALANKPASVSLDQMLVALLRANPDAFVNNNINRVKSGAVMNVPSAEQAQALSPAEATQTVIAQSKDFNEFRKKLATSAPAAQVAAADRQASGSVQTKVEDKKPSAAAPDKLTLSKGAIKAQAEADKVAKDRATKEAAERAAEVAKNINELNKLGTATSSVAAASGTATGAPAAPSATPAPAAIPVAPVVAPAPAASAQAPVAAPAAPGASAPVKRAPIPVPAPAPEPSMVDQLIENPLVPAAAGGIIALLAGLGIYRSRQRKKAGQIDSAFLESRLQPDSFFGASGGQRVDTNDGAATGSSMVYSPSQLDAADDVDPVAEADVYLAYGRDLQAEEILKEALKTNSGRVAIHQKLLDIYAKRRDARSFETAASNAYKATGGDGAEWDRICDLGLSIDPTNPLYQPGGKPAAGAEPSAPAPLDAAAAVATLASTAPMLAQPAAPASVDLDLDLDLDFSLDDEQAVAVPAAPVAAPVLPVPEAPTAEQTTKMAAVDAAPPSLDMDFDLPMSAAPAPAEPEPAKSGDLIEFALPELDGLSAQATTGDSEDFKQEAAVSFGATEASPLLATPLKGALDLDIPAQPAPAAQDSGMLEFDLGSLSLDLGDNTKTETPAAAASEDPLATKLALAEEFSTIGDDDGARALIEEVILEATGDMKLRAQKALAKLN